MTKKSKTYSLSLEEKMEMVRMSVRAVTRGYKVSRLILGSPGIGKSYAVLDELRNEEVNFIHIKGGIKDSKAFYIALYKNNDPNVVIVLDDVNDLLRKRQNIEILRAAVENEEERKIAFFENRLLIDGNKSYHPTMIFKSKIIIITNIAKSKIDTGIYSRTSPIEIIADKYSIAPYIEKNIENAPPQKLKLEWKMEAWNYILNELKLDNIKHLDFRVFEDVCMWVAAEKDRDIKSDMWKKYAYTILT